jgi:UDP-N-acetylglucosamine--N-acetylmuramyl-(pentapeptide) pyrophosphoryl-undecaprenol N-acetylglucosamine transferase
MRLIVTGGGTGGHIYPALVVGRIARESGAELLYYGSFRGQESKACQEQGIPFTGFESYPLYSLRTLRGIKALIKLQQARGKARIALKSSKPDVVFSTGGYSAGPVVAAARDLGIPYTIHTSDSIPPRSSRMFALQARAFTCTFRSTPEVMKERPVVRTGQPIRRELRQAAADRSDTNDFVFVVGGSQGSAFLNSAVPQAAKHVSSDVRFLHACGPDHLKTTSEEVDRLGLADRYEVVPYLKTEQMVQAYRKATVVVARSGGTVAEIALFGLPSVLVPLPGSANDHQAHNAQEFVKMNAATLLNQSAASPNLLGQAMNEWLSDSEKRRVAKKNLSEWDVPDAAEQIFALIQGAAN